MNAPRGVPDLFALIFRRAFRSWRRWDEGLWRWFELSATRRFFEERAEWVRGPILDVGCGDGEVFSWIFGRRGDAYGIEPSFTHADDTRRASASGVYVEVRSDDARHTSFPAGYFQLVFANSVVEHVSPVEPLIGEVFRVLKPGGAFVFTTPDPRLYSPDGYYWRSVLRTVGLDPIGRWLAQQECQAYVHSSVLDFACWRELLSSAGFVNVERFGYVSDAAARAITRYGALTRAPGLSHLAQSLSPEARRIGAKGAAVEEEWVARCYTVLASLARAAAFASPGCGQLIVARKPQV